MASQSAVPREQLQPPFRQKDLLSVDRFIRYCRQYDIRTDKEELEFFDQENLLLPAVSVRREIASLKKIYADFDGKGVKEWRYVNNSDLHQFHYEEIDPAPYYDFGAIPRINASFLARVHPLSCRSRRRASASEGNCSA